jgi:hypothetical protein
MIIDGPAAARWFELLRWMTLVKHGKVKVSIPILDLSGRETGVLRPIDYDDLLNEPLLEQFVRWRNQNLEGYLDQRPVSIEGVKRYVEDVVFNPTRISFLAICDGKPIARMGAVKITPIEHEADGLVRGERGGGIRFLYYAQISALTFLFKLFNHERLIARILSSNDLAIENCSSFGYDIEPIVEQPIYRKVHDMGLTLETSGNADEILEGVTLKTLQLTRKSFYQQLESLPIHSKLLDLVNSLIPCELLDIS